MNRFKTSLETHTGFLLLVLLATFMQTHSATAQWEAPAGYYAAASSNGATLKNQLTSIMASGHIQRTYGNFRFSTAIHDQDPNNPSNVILVYNGASVSGVWDNGTTWNREHVWPQARQPGSVSNASQGNLGDPHALRPANPNVNALRENKPFGFDTTTGPFANLGQYWFPGDTCKGDIARSLFYSDTRWTSLGLTLTDDFPSGFEMGKLSSQIAWHYLDPPDEFERRRNHTIYSSDFNPQYFTNNRNAYIDRPEFVWSIYVGQQNDSMITINGGAVNGDGESSLALDFGTAIVGTTISTSQTVTLNKNGLDGTYYSIQVFENATSDLNGSNNAFRMGATDFSMLNVGLEFDPAVPGVKSGLIVVDNLDITTQGGPGRGDRDGNDFIVPTLTLLDHANASFSGTNDQNIQSLDLGEFNLGQPIPETPFQIHNLGSTFGNALTARLDLQSFESIPATNSLSVSGPLFANLSAGECETFSLSGVADELGSFLIDFSFQLSDEDLSGALGQTITLSVAYDVIESSTLGDINQDGLVNLLDVTPFIDLLASGGFQTEADINQDGLVNLTDVGPFVDLLTGN